MCLCWCRIFLLFFLHFSFSFALPVQHFNISIQFSMIFIAISVLLLVPDFECHINRSLIFIMAENQQQQQQHHSIMCCILTNKNQTKHSKNERKCFHNFSLQLQSDSFIDWFYFCYYFTCTLYPNKTPANG